MGGATHHAVMLWCEVLRWRAPHPPPTTPKRDAGEDVSMAGEGRGEDGGREAVLVVFQPVPNECPRLGVDPRVAKGRLGKGRRWEAGVWGPWSEADLPMSPLRLHGREGDDGEEEWGGIPMGLEGRGREEQGGRTKVLMATRYLVAQTEAETDVEV